MINMFLIEMARVRTGVDRSGAKLERLRRAGYADGERRPRTPRHWANR